MNEITEFSLFHHFLESFADPDITPRGDELNDEEKAILRRIARGESTDQERTAALELLTAKADAVEFLAGRLNNG